MCPICLWAGVFDHASRRCGTCGLDEIDFKLDNIQKLDKEDGIYKVLLRDFIYVAIIQHSKLVWLMHNGPEPKNVNKVFMEISQGNGNWSRQRLINVD